MNSSFLHVPGIPDSNSQNPGIIFLISRPVPGACVYMFHIVQCPHRPWQTLSEREQELYKKKVEFKIYQDHLHNVIQLALGRIEPILLHAMPHNTMHYHGIPFIHPSTNVTPVTQDHFYSINATQDREMSWYIISCNR